MKDQKTNLHIQMMWVVLQDKLLPIVALPNLSV